MNRDNNHPIVCIILCSLHIIDEYSNHLFQLHATKYVFDFFNVFNKKKKIPTLVLRTRIDGNIYFSFSGYINL